MSHETSVQPRLAELFAGYLERQTQTMSAGIATHDHEVVPFEVGPVQPLDPMLAWDEAVVAIGSAQGQRPQAPPHWSSLVANHDSLFAIAFCAGNFPQLMRDFHVLLSERNLTQLPGEAGQPSAAPELKDWAEKIGRQGQFPQMLLALGTLRLARHYSEAQAFVQANDSVTPEQWRNAWENEKAALAWHSGHADEARRAWEALQPSLPVLFNRGMAALFTGERGLAKQHLSAAIAQLPENSAWHHLAQLYLTLAQLS